MKINDSVDKTLSFEQLKRLVAESAAAPALKKQFKAWAKYTLRVNPDYVTDVNRLRDYLRSPNWDGYNIVYAHYKQTIQLYGAELVDLFERLRSEDEEVSEQAIDEYNGLLSGLGLKKSVMESEVDEFVYIPLGLTADKSVSHDVEGADVEGNPSPWTIIDDLYGQLSDGMWENSPAMEKWWMPADLTERNGELCLKVKVGPVAVRRRGMRTFDENPYVDGEGRFNAPKIREWIANHLKQVVQSEVGQLVWRRESNVKLDYFENGTTVGMVYAVYDILKFRPGRNKNVWFKAFEA